MKLFGSKKPKDKLASIKPSKNQAGPENVEGPMVGRPIPKNYEVLERYALTPPFAYAVIAEDTSQKLPYYYVDELELTTKELTLYNNILTVLQT